MVRIFHLLLLDGSSVPRTDSFGVYGRAKDEFGWKEKMEAPATGW